MKLLRKYDIGDNISYTFYGAKKKGKIREIRHPFQYEIEEVFDDITVDDLLYVIETNERDEDGIIVDNMILEYNIL